MKSKKAFFLLALLIGIGIAIRFAGVGQWLTLEYIKTQTTYLQLFIQKHYLLSFMLFIGIYIVEASLALPFAALLTVTGGYLFGTIAGALYTNIGATIGATIVFLLVRYSMGAYVQERYAAPLKQFDALTNRYGNRFLLVARFIVVFPFFLVNLLAGLTSVSVWTFVWTTSLGILPGSLVYSFAGGQLQELQSVNDIFSPMMMLAFAGIAALILVPLILKGLKNI